MKYKFIYSLFLIIIASCESKDEPEHTSYNVDLINIGKINFNIDSITPLSSTSMWSFLGTGGREYLTYGIAKDQYKIFDLEKRREISQINLKNEGPNAIPSVRGGLFPINENEFLIGEMAAPNIYKIDSNGNIIQKYNYEIESKYGRNTDAGTSVYGAKPFLEKNGKIYGFDTFYGPWGNWDKDYVFSKPLLLEIDTNGGSAKALPVTLPSNLWDHGPRLPLLMYDFYGDNLILSIYGDHNVYKSDFKGIMKSFPAQSKFIEDFEDFPLDGNPQDFFKYQVMNGAYSSIMYDQFRKIFYRFAIHPFKPADMNYDWLKGKKFPVNVSIIILDENLQVIGETLLPSKTHNIYNSFITKKGLFISNSHPDNPNLIEDVLSFTLYNPKNKNEQE